MLGTGAADGWPNAFCGCASCATLRGRGEVRAQTAALLDDVLLLDCGPDVPAAASHAGRSLAGVRHVLLTHAHPDHVGPAALLWRSWAGRREPLTVHGPRDALDLCRDWIGPEDRVTLRPVRRGDVLDCAGYRVRVLEAAHDGAAVLYLIDCPDGTRLLWATDTGPMPEATHAALAGAAVDLLLLEETFGDVTGHGTGHLDLATFPRELARLRRDGAVTAATDVVAVHLGHHNPPEPELGRRLAAWGARTVPDGTVVRVTRPVALARRRPLRTLVLGGARSGKSREAERLLAGDAEVLYVATARDRPDDAEWAARVAAHRARRPAGWTTVETRDVAGVLRAADRPVLVDCLSLWLADTLEHDERDARVEDLLAAWRSVRVPVVAVSNEVGSGVVPATASGRTFRDELGRLNARVAAASERTLLVVAGKVLAL